MKLNKKNRVCSMTFDMDLNVQYISKLKSLEFVHGFAVNLKIFLEFLSYRKWRMSSAVIQSAQAFAGRTYNRF